MGKRDENTEGLGRAGRCLGRLLWLCMILAAISLVVFAVWGLCATAAALDRGESWAEWVSGILFLIAFLLIVREINRQ